MDLKDFIYLDIDRVRSFTSQLFEGIPETIDSKNGKKQDIKGKFKGGVPFLASGGVEGGLLLRQEKTETKSLQPTFRTLILYRSEFINSQDYEPVL